MVAAIALVATVLYVTSDDDEPTLDLSVGWGGSEGNPSCVYRPEDNVVDARLTIRGTAPEGTTVTATVTAYADENTSQPVGTGSRSVPVEGTVDLPLVVTITVSRAPHIGEDAETACRLSVKY